MKSLDVYTDGGCLGNPGPGGWAALIYEAPKPTEISGREKATTNQRMELRAAIQSLRYLRDPIRVRLHSDSAYLINGMKQKWYAKWQQNGWLNSKKRPVENPDLWKELIELAEHHSVDWVKVKGHSGVGANERCDALVQLEIAKATGRPGSAKTPDLPEDENDLPPRTIENTGTSDEKPIGKTDGNIFLSLVNRRGVFATSFDSAAFDGIAFDPEHRLFQVGASPFLMRIEGCRSDTAGYRSKSVPDDEVHKIWSFAKNLGISRDSSYFVVGFSKETDSRTIRYFAVPMSSLDGFKEGNRYVFSVGKCEEAMHEDVGIFCP